MTPDWDSIEERDPYYFSDAWKRKRHERMEMDGHACQLCGRRMAESGLEVHHLTYERWMHEDVQNDLVTLCHTCHSDMVHRMQAYLQFGFIPTLWDGRRTLCTETGRVEALSTMALACAMAHDPWWAWKVLTCRSGWLNRIAERAGELFPECSGWTFAAGGEHPNLPDMGILSFGSYKRDHGARRIQNIRKITGDIYVPVFRNRKMNERYQEMKIDWQNVQESAENPASAVESGGYVCGIVKATYETTKKGAKALVIVWDIVEGPHKGEFSNEFYKDKDFRHNDYIMLEGNGLSMAKRKLKTISESNPGFDAFGVVADPDTIGHGEPAKAFVGKYIGLVLQERKYTYNGKDRSEVNVSSYKTPDQIRGGEFEVPETIDDRTHTAQAAAADDGEDEKLPWE